MIELIDATGLYVRLVSIRFRPDGIDNAMDRFRQVSSPLVRKQPGSIGLFGGGNRVSGSAYSASVWESHEDLERSNGVPEVVEAMADYAEWMTGSFVMESFHVVAGKVVVASSTGVASVWGRVVSTIAVPGQLTHALDAMSERLAQVQALSFRCLGVVLLSPLVGTKIVAIEYWDSQGSVNASESRVHGIDQRLTRPGTHHGSINRDVIEILVVS